MDYVAWPEYGDPKRFETELEAEQYLERLHQYGWIYKYVRTVN